MSALQVQVKCLLTSRGCGAAEAGYVVLGRGPTEAGTEGVFQNGRDILIGKSFRFQPMDV